MTEPTALPADAVLDSAADLTSEDFDVEGHGLKEIAAGLSTVAVLATGAAGIAHATADSPHKATVQAGGVTISVQTDGSDPTAEGKAMAHQTAHVVATKAGEVQAAGMAAEHQVAQAATNTVTQVVAQSLTAVHAVRDRAVTQVEATVATTTTTVHKVAAAAQQHMADGQQQVDHVVTGAKGTGADTAATVKTQVHAVTTHMGTTLDHTRTTVVNLSQVAVDGVADAIGAGGTMSVSVDGVVVGSATVEHGQATIHWTAPEGGSHTVVVSYGGDALHAPSTLNV
jgi:hypothetical protein